MNRTQRRGGAGVCLSDARTRRAPHNESLAAATQAFNREKFPNLISFPGRKSVSSRSPEGEALLTTQSQRTAPHPSVNTSTRSGGATQFLCSWCGSCVNRDHRYIDAFKDRRDHTHYASRLNLSQRADPARRCSLCRLLPYAAGRDCARGNGSRIV